MLQFSVVSRVKPAYAVCITSSSCAISKRVVDLSSGIEIRTRDVG